MSMNKVGTERCVDNFMIDHSGKSRSLSFYDNSLNTVRLLAALQVYYSHAVAHMKLPSNQSVSTIIGIFQGVPIFFILSGFLIWISLDKTPTFGNFFKKRALRIYPELWCAVLLCIVSIVVLYDGFRIGELALFAVGQATILQFWTPDSLRGYGCGTPNGCLASIFMIVQFYIVVYFIKKMKPVKVILAILLIIGFVLNILSPMLSRVLPAIVYKLWDVSLLPYIWLFMLGAFVSEYFNVLLPLMRKYWYVCLLLLLVQGFIGVDIPGEYGVIKTILQCFTWIGFAYALPNLNVKHDISYEIFLYHMVVINVFIQIGLIESLLYFVLATIIIVILSILSYIFKKKCMNV